MQVVLQVPCSLALPSGERIVILESPYTAEREDVAQFLTGAVAAGNIQLAEEPQVPEQDPQLPLEPEDPLAAALAVAKNSAK